jgi:hypothetical protein
LCGVGELSFTLDCVDTGVEGHQGGPNLAVVGEDRVDQAREGAGRGACARGDGKRSASFDAMPTAAARRAG